MPKDTIHVIAQSIGISNLQDDVAAALAPDVEYRMREIMQVGCAFHVFSQFSTPLCQVCSQCPTLPNLLQVEKNCDLDLFLLLNSPSNFCFKKHRLSSDQDCVFETLNQHIKTVLETLTLTRRKNNGRCHIFLVIIRRFLQPSALNLPMITCYVKSD